MNTTSKFHVGLHVSDIDKSAAFYQTLLEKEPVKLFGDYAKFETDQLVLSLIRSSKGGQPAFGHFGIRVDDTSELNRHYARMHESDHPLLLEGKTECCYAIQDKFWVKDPDGYDWEFYQFIEDAQGMTSKPEDETVGAAPCCTPGTCC